MLGPVADARPDLERLIEVSLDDPGAYLVYADWLEEQGDPLAALVRLGVAMIGGGARAEADFHVFIRDNAAAIFGDAEHDVKARLDLSWRLGFVSQVRTMTEMRQSFWKLLWRQRAFRFVRSLSTRCWIVCPDKDPMGADGSADAGTAFIDDAPPTLQRLERTEVGQFELLPRMLTPALRTVEIGGGHVFLPVDLPASLSALRLSCIAPTLVGEASGTWPIDALTLEVNDHAGRLLERVALPRVSTLRLEQRIPVYEPADGSAIVAALAKRDLDSLRGLVLSGGPSGPGLLEALADLPLADHVETMKLDALDLSDHDVPRLSRALARFTRLWSLEIVDDGLSSEAHESLLAATA